MFSPPHIGLTLTEAHIQRARKHKKDAPYFLAWTHLNEREPTSDLDSLLLTGLRYRFNADVNAGERGAMQLLQYTLESDADDRLTQLQAAFTLSQAFELLREHPAVGQPDAWFNHYRDYIASLDQETESIVEKLWLAVVHTAAGIVLEDERLFSVGVDELIRTIDEDVHPEGYLRQAVNVHPEAQSLYNQIACVQAMTLIAEMAAHAGRDLWAYENRGVSVTTATTYPLYYYFYPEQWRWNGMEFQPSTGVSEADAKAIFTENAGFLEIVNGRYDKPLKAVKLMLTDLRPVYDKVGGGLTTLSHGLLEKRRGLFG